MSSACSSSSTGTHNVDSSSPHARPSPSQSTSASTAWLFSPTPVKGNHNFLQNLTSFGNPIYGNSTERITHVTGAVAEYLISDMQPVSTVENSAFKKLFTVMDPSYVLPSATDFEKVLSDMVEQQKPTIENHIQTGKHIAVSLEIFKVNVSESCMTISIHMITKEWQMCLKTLRTIDISENVTGDTENYIHHILMDWEIPERNIVGIVSESRLSFEGIPSMSDTNIQHYTCFDKTLKTAASCAIGHPDQGSEMYHHL